MCSRGRQHNDPDSEEDKLRSVLSVTTRTMLKAQKVKWQCRGGPGHSLPMRVRTHTQAQAVLEDLIQVPSGKGAAWLHGMGS